MIRRTPRLGWSAEVAGEAPRVLERPVDLLEVHGVVEVVLLGGTNARDVEVVHDEQLFFGVGGLQEFHARGRPYARAAPEDGAADAVGAHRVAGKGPDLVCRRVGR